MFSTQKNKLKINTKKQLQQLTNKPKSKSIPKSLNKSNKSQSIIQKNTIIHEKQLSIPTTTLSTHKQKPSYNLDKNTKKPSQHQPHQRLSLNNESKEFNKKAQNSKQKKQIKYIFNPVTNSKNRNSLTINQQKQHSLSNIKNYSNKCSAKNIPSYDLSSFNKSVETTKMKKKSHQYIKTFNKTSVFDRGGSRLQNTLVDEMNQTCKLGKTWAHGQSLKNFRQIKITDQQLDEVNDGLCPKISQIRQNVNNLFKKLKQPNRNKLLLITNKYEKIVSQLYEKINSHQNNKLTVDDNSEIQGNKHIKQNIVKIDDSSSSTQAMIQDCSDTQHWDSYLEFDDQQKYNAKTCPGSNCKQNLIKKLNLGDIKKTQIKQYQDQFMDNQQIFSESWKRQIDRQKRF